MFVVLSRPYSASTRSYLVLRVTWSNLNGEDIAFVGDLEDLCPDEAIETQSVAVDDQSGSTHSDVHWFSVCVLTTDRRSVFTDRCENRSK